MKTPVRRGSPATDEDSGGLDAENVSFSDPCPCCRTNKRYCLHGSCGPRKKLRLTTIPAIPCPPAASLQRSLSLPFWGASPPGKSPTILRSQSDLVSIGQGKEILGTQSDLVSVGQGKEILGTERTVNQMKEAKSEPASPQVGTTSTATPPSEVGSKKKYHLQSTPTGLTGTRMVENLQSAQTEATEKRILRRTVFPSRTRRRLQMPEVARTEKSEETQMRNLSLKENENGENNTRRLTPKDEDGHSPPAAADPATSDDTDGDEYLKRVLMREIEGRLDKIETKLKELIALREDTSILTVDRRPSCQHTPAAADGQPPPSTPISAAAASSWDVMLEGNDQEAVKACYLVCYCNRCRFG